MKKLPRSGRDVCRAAFSLVEVVLALAVVSICLVSVMGMIYVGFRGMRSSTEQAAAGIVLGQIANDIRDAASTNVSSTTSQAIYYGLGICTNLCWTNGGTGITNVYTPLSLGGVISTTNQSLIAHVQLYPAASASSTGTALISVAWPQQAIWNAATTNWTKAEGSISTYLIFVPRL